MSNSVEIEAKFIIPDIDTFETLTRLSQLDAFEIKDIGLKTIIDRYLDTPARQLMRAGYACRIRKSDDRQILTIKSLVAAEGDVHRRQEIETDVNGDQPHNWVEGEARQLVLNIIGETPLDTLFTLYQTRHKFHVFIQNRRILELSLDKVSFHQPTTIDYTGLEAELIDDGTDADLTRFARSLQNKWPLRADTKSKFERALAAINQQ